MSFLDKLKAKLKSFFTQAPAWETVAKSAINYCAPLVQTVATLISPESAPEVQVVIDKIKTGLAAAHVLIGEQGSETTVASVIANVLGDLPLLLQAVQVKNPQSAEKITVYTNLIAGELQALLANIPTKA